MNELRQIRKPELVTIGNHQTISHGMWNHDVMADYVLKHGHDHWIEIGELARLVWRHNSQANRDAVRKRLSPFKRVMVTNHNRLLLVEYSGRRGAATAVKLYDRTSPADEQAALRMIAEMEVRRDRMTDFYKTFIGLVLANHEDKTQ